MHNGKKTKIVCTIGPASNKTQVLREMMGAGMDVARINCSHGDHGQYLRIINSVRKLGSDAAIMIDLQGPEARIEVEKKLLLFKGQKFTISTRKTGRFAFIDYPLHKYVKTGDRLLVGDGELELRVFRTGKDKVECNVLNDAEIEGRKSVHIVGKVMPMKFLSEKDRSDIRFALKHKVDFIAASFVQSADDVRAIRKILKSSNIHVIAKIESRSAAKNIDEIIAESDAVMVARGDLGLVMPAEDVPLLQKKIINKCNIAGKPVITATQMLESMVLKPRPTRAETSDVANAILDGSDAVMLSGETAAGKYPIKAVKEMTRIAKKVEPSVEGIRGAGEKPSIAMAVAEAVDKIVKRLDVDKILTATSTGHTARMIARYRPKVPVIAITKNGIVKRQMNIVYGVIPVIVKIKKATPTERMSKTIRTCLNKKLLKMSDTVVITGGITTLESHSTNFIRIHDVKGLMGYYKKRGLVR